MKKLLILFLICGCGRTAFAQGQPENIKIMEKRAREMFAAIVSADEDQWKKFVIENYSKALIDKPMMERIEGRDGSSSTPVAGKTQQEKVDAKARMFARLHSDFGASKISSLNTTVEQVEMTLDGNDGSAIITLKFDQKKPYLINGLGIDARQ
jgi:hypothetical protein